MNGLSQISGAVIAALQGAGLTAAPAYAGAAREIAGPAAAVDVADAGSRPVGFGDYLGQSWDESTGAVRELYGRQMDVCIRVDVRCESAAGCETAMETAAQALLTALPAGIRPGELAWEAVAWEKSTQRFLRRGRLKCRAAFIAETDAESGALLDFTLKGVVTH